VNVLVVFYPFAMSSKTLGYAAERRMMVVGRCKQCGRQAKTFASDLAGYYGKHKDYRSVKFRCTECDPGTCDIHLEPDGFDRMAERVVWRPVVMKDRQ
jgi:hypothetical protein